jgi:hypothetical protein
MNYVLYEGPSAINTEPIVAILTGVDRPSQNTKTGNQAQLWVFCANTPPIEAVKDETDVAICGTCPLRKVVCYVNLAHGPQNIWKSWKANPKAFTTGFPPAAQTKRRSIRLTAYGDPGALPIEVIEKCVARFKSHTGYSHLWREHPHLQKYIMASVETPELAAEAQALGFRTFRIRGSTEEPRLKGEALCPFESANLQCVDCRACNGKTGPFTSNIVVTVHGVGGKIQKFHALTSTAPEKTMKQYPHSPLTPN